MLNVPTYPLFLPSFGMGEMAILFVIVLVLFGPGKLPEVCRSLGDGIRQFKRSVKDDDTTIKPDEPKKLDE